MTASGPQTSLSTGTGPLLALHGFLGLPSDWDLIDFEIPNSVRPIDLWSEISSAHDLSSWADRFNEQVRTESLPGNKKPVLLGYSMGGRLAMQATLQAPEIYAGLIVVSAHPGLATEDERRERLRSDKIWAERFRTEDWRELTAAWMSQGVLKTASSHGDVFGERREREFDREDLARAMEIWSLGRQADLRPLIASSPLPILFLSGATDEKFTKLLRSLELQPSQKFQVIEGAGHRVPWEQPQAFTGAVREFLATLPDFC